jgi:hypothetical protein
LAYSGPVGNFTRSQFGLPFFRIGLASMVGSSIIGNSIQLQSKSKNVLSGFRNCGIGKIMGSVWVLKNLFSPLISLSNQSWLGLSNFKGSTFGY